MMNSPNEQTMETIQAMRRQEELAYTVPDYLSCLPAAAFTICNSTPVDASCRFAMSKWCDDISDHCNYNRETVAIAMNCLDRFMSTASGQEILFNRSLYQLAAMTALYSSVKIHEQEAIDPQLMSSLSNGIHSAQAVEAMESKMLTAIQWRVNPPTAMSFVRSMIDLLPSDCIDSCSKETILDVARVQIELIVNKYEFCTSDASSIALACVLNAIESLTDDGMVCANFETVARKIMSIEHAVVQDLRIAIYELINGSDCNVDFQTTNSATAEKLGSSCTAGATVATKDNSSFRSSPRSTATHIV
jgi:hypothetical protein|uniref:Cyclin N-terminal domain-containing protein n=1 Tax=Pseudo-nitzschia australis TaxID=44445 RepID=A0A7S4AKJ4_9STRA